MDGNEDAPRSVAALHASAAPSQRGCRGNLSRSPCDPGAPVRLAQTVVDADSCAARTATRCSNPVPPASITLALSMGWASRLVGSSAQLSSDCERHLYLAFRRPAWRRSFACSSPWPGSTCAQACRSAPLTSSYANPSAIHLGTSDGPDELSCAYPNRSSEASGDPANGGQA